MVSLQPSRSTGSPVRQLSHFVRSPVHQFAGSPVSDRLPVGERLRQLLAGAVDVGACGHLRHPHDTGRFLRKTAPVRSAAPPPRDRPGRSVRIAASSAWPSASRSTGSAAGGAAGQRAVRGFGLPDRRARPRAGRARRSQSSAVLWAMRNSQLERRRVTSKPPRLRNALTKDSCASSSADAAVSDHPRDEADHRTLVAPHDLLERGLRAAERLRRRGGPR